MVYLDAQRLIFPKKAVPKVLKMLHSGHCSITKTYEMARSLYYWPGMYNDIVQMTQSCAVCGSFGPLSPMRPEVRILRLHITGLQCNMWVWTCAIMVGSSSWSVSIIGAVSLYSAK